MNISYVRVSTKMDFIALRSAIEAYEADLCSPARRRGTCIEMCANARNAATEAFKKHQSPAPSAQDSKSEGLLAAAEHHEYHAQAWHDSAIYLSSRPEGMLCELALERSESAYKQALVHQSLPKDFRDLSAGKTIINEFPSIA